MRLLLFAWLPLVATGLRRAGALVEAGAPVEAGVLDDYVAPQRRFQEQRQQQRLQQQRQQELSANGLPSRLTAQRHRPVIWVHVHKAGGTAMCKLATSNNETMMSGVDYLSCNFWSDDVKRWVPTRRPDCADHYVRWSASGFTWSQIERPFLAGDLCPGQFFYGTMIRHPVSLARSAVNFYDVFQGTWTGVAWPLVVSCLEGRQAGHRAACAMSFEWLPHPNAHWMYFDNYMVRVFGGLEVWNLPPGTVNATHRQLALDRLSKFDLVLTLEQFCSNQTRSTLARTFGWERLGAIDEMVKHQEEKFTDFTESDIKRIEKLNSHDLILYETMRERESARR